MSVNERVETRRERRTYVAPTDRLVTAPFIVVTVSALAFFMYIGTLLPLIPLYIEGPLGGGEFDVGLNVAVFAVAAIIARPFIGRLADRFGRRAVMVAGTLIAAAGGFGMSQVESIELLLAFRMLTGIGEAAMFVGAATLIADLSPRDRRAEGASYFSVAVFTGLGIGPVLGEFVLNDTEFERTFIMGGVFAVIAGAIALFVPAFVVSPDAQTGRSVLPGASPQRTGLARYVHPAAVLPGIVLALGVGGLTTFFLFVPEYSRDLGMGSSGGLFLVYALMSLLIRIFGATLPERLGPRRMVTVALVALGVGLVAVAAIDAIWVLWFAAVMMGIGAAFNYPSLNALTVNRVGDDERALAISSFTMFFEIGSAMSGLTVGALGEVVGKQSAFYGGVAMVAVGLFVLRRFVVPSGSPDAGPTVEARPMVASGDALSASSGD
ncbi:MFS transporter [Ilumatobacter nonamiensis]|uniref:MFS transporter n=1 Tax=Ilumatobacter nonamiensis TaxID=467093 RepID=UPI0003469126|nr:MFS transporter [Ilumatobacter nonamiensis]